MKVDGLIRPIYVNCRIGSSESGERMNDTEGLVNCRIGSLEVHDNLGPHSQAANCRISAIGWHSVARCKTSARKVLTQKLSSRWHRSG